MIGQDALRRAVIELARAGVEDPARDARRLLAHALDMSSSRLSVILPEPLSASAHGRFAALIARRSARQPVSHLTGYRDFYGLRFKVTDDVLDPRPETETLVEAALAQPFSSVLDLGTGSGCILLSLLSVAGDARGTGTDISPAALEVAGANARAFGLDARVRLITSDWFDKVGGCFDLIVSNPPYIGADELPGLAPEVRDWEPLAALSPGADALAAYRTIVAAAPGYLAPDGRLLVEIGATQGEAVTDLFRAAGFEKIRVLKDLAGQDRVVGAEAR